VGEDATLPGERRLYGDMAQTRVYHTNPTKMSFDQELVIIS
jgi:hypothetical protein